MAKKRNRNQNPQPFLPEEDVNSVASTKKRSKASKQHQNPDKMISEEIDEDDERLLEAFLSKDAGPQQTLADLIIKKIKENDANLSSELASFLNLCFKSECEEGRTLLQLVLLPRIRDDIRKNKKLHFSLFQALKKSIYKPAAFNKGILFPLCKSGTCNLREAVIVGSILQKVSIPMLHSSVALLKLAEMEYCGTTSYFIKLLLEKKYGLPYRVVDAIFAHFMRFYDDPRIMPVIWHQSLLLLCRG
ncbi:hypothetical protein LWI29_009862 [Acer saccharum]|uniref:Bystin n=1 Tax=Acer saccharum TaxID=4024 RepID=A0AA39W2I8_ACESA|nr:hypothetical protein LWI29_009862 [Acer saccharum]